MLTALDHELVPADLSVFYDDLASRTAHLHESMYRTPAQRARFERIMELAAQTAGPHKRCLELGCAEGQMTARLATVFERVVAVEISRVLLSRCPVLPNVRYVVGDIEKDPMGSNEAYDLVVMSEVLEHLVDPRAAILRYAAQGRYLLASCPITELSNPVGAFDVTLLGQEVRSGDATGHIWAMDWDGFLSLFETLDIVLAERVFHSGVVLCRVASVSR